MRRSLVGWEGVKVPHLRVLETEGEVLVTICDESLFGKEFKEGELRLKIARSFYEGKKVDVTQCLKALERATVANMVGSIVKHAIKAGFVDPKNVLKIEGISHAQMTKM